MAGNLRSLFLSCLFTFNSRSRSRGAPPLRPANIFHGAREVWTFARWNVFVTAVGSMTQLTNISITAISHIVGGSPGTDRTSQLTIRDTVRSLDCRPGTGTHTLTRRAARAINLVINSISSPFFNTVIGTIRRITCRANGFLLVNGNCRGRRGRHRTVRRLVHRHYTTLIIRTGVVPSTSLTSLVGRVPNVILVGHVLPNFRGHYVTLSSHCNT